MSSGDAELVRNCLKGDNQAFGLLIERYQEQVVRYCARLLGSADDGAETAQESFVKAYQGLARYRSEAPFVPWLLAIAHNSCLDQLRRKRRRPVDYLEDAPDGGASVASTEAGPEERALRSETHRFIREAVTGLPEKIGQAVSMFYFAGLSIREISEQMRCPEGTVKFNLHAGREMLRKVMEGHTNEL